MAQKLSKRAEAARRNGKLGGQKTARTHSPEFLEARASRAGCSTRDKYGIEFYRHIGALSKKRGGGIGIIPADKHRQDIIQEILPSGTPDVSSSVLMKAAAATIDL